MLATIRKLWSWASTIAVALCSSMNSARRYALTKASTSTQAERRLNTRTHAGGFDAPVGYANRLCAEVCSRGLVGSFSCRSFTIDNISHWARDCKNYLHLFSDLLDLTVSTFILVI